MKTALLSFSDISGGAARAAYRIHQALRGSGVDSSMYVTDAASGDWTVQGPESKFARLKNIFRSAVGQLFNRMHTSANPILHSVALLPSKWPAKINSSEVELVHLVWVNGEMLSIEDIGKFRKPMIWTLQDMWAICGAEHVSYDRRFIDGYSKVNRPSDESGWDINRYTWMRKKRAWQHPINIVVPSNWMADCVRKSVLMRNWPVTVIANPIDTERWFPIEKSIARKLMRLPEEVPLLLFGTSGVNDAPHKGFDLLIEALKHLRGKTDLHLVIFGQLAPENPADFGFPVHYAGHLYDDISMQVLYSATDLAVIPSRLDNLPNVGIEAIACGTPVVAFDVCGLPDIVKHQVTGYLAKAFDAADLANGVLWMLADKQRYLQMCRRARADAVERFSYPVIASQYQTLYESVIATS